jgi:hypothetical protein
MAGGGDLTGGVEMDWKQATRGQLLEIALHDTKCNPRHKIEAMAELTRRNRQQSYKQQQCKIRRKRA